MTTWAHRSFSAGEISEHLHARSDWAKYQTGLKTLRNAIVLREGGVMSRPGTVLVGPAGSAGSSTRLVPYSYSRTVDYILEIGNASTRVIYNGQHLLASATSAPLAYTPVAIVDVDDSVDPVVVEATAHGLTGGERIKIQGVTSGAPELEQYEYEATYVDANNIKLKRVVDGGWVSPTDLSSSWGLGGSIYRVFEINTPWPPSELTSLTFSQHGNEMVFASSSYRPRVLKRGSSHVNWTITDGVYQPDMKAPVMSTFTDRTLLNDASPGPPSPGPLSVLYVATAINKDTGEESLPCRRTWFERRDEDDDSVYANAVPGGSGELLGPSGVNLYYEIQLVIEVTAAVGGGSNTLVVSGVDNDGVNHSETFALGTVTGRQFTAFRYKRVDSLMYTQVTAAAFKVGNVEEHRYCANQLNMTAPVSTVWSGKAISAEDIAGYNIYADKHNTGTYGWIGFSQSLSFADTGLVPDLSDNPPATVDLTVAPPGPVTTDPFESSGNYPAAVCRHQGRLVFAGTDNYPERVWMSKIGRPGNFDIDYPITQDDAVIFTADAGLARNIRHLVPAERLLVFCQTGEVIASGDSAGVISPGAVNLRQVSFNGVGRIAPIVIAGNVLHMPAFQNAVFDMGYRLDSDGYRGSDISVFSSHLFSGDKYALAWAYQKNPWSVIWIVMADGGLLSLTYMPEQQVHGWARHDTGGSFKSVTSIPINDGDAPVPDMVYFVVEREGRSFVERTETTRNALSYAGLSRDDLLLMDSCLSYDGRNQTTQKLLLDSGTTWDEDDTGLEIYSIGSYSFPSDIVGKKIVLRSGADSIRCLVTARLSSTRVSVEVDTLTPESLRAVGTSDWGVAVKTVSGLYHLEGMAVSARGDGHVLASPNNPEYSLVYVTDGKATFSEHAERIHVGLPFEVDVETLDVDTLQGETLLDKRSQITAVTLVLRKSLGLFVGSTNPGPGSVEGLTEPKIRQYEDHDSPTEEFTGKVTVQIMPEWKRSGGVFIRQVDPLPLELLAVLPSGGLQLRRGGA